MRGRIGVASSMAAACFALMAIGLHADEICDKGYRHPTPEEEAAMQAVLESALRALPSELTGWVGAPDDALSVDSQCEDDDPRPWNYDFDRRFNRVDDIEVREGIAEEASAEYQAARQANQPAMDAVMAKIQELSQAAVAAAEAGDHDKVDAINVEIEQASAEYQALMEGGGALAKLDAAGEEVSRDQSIRIAVAVNPGYEPLGYEFQAVTPPAGAAQAFRWRDGGSGPHDATEIVLFGSWRADGSNYNQVSRDGVAHTVTQAVSVKVTADESRIDSVLASIDFAALGALVSH